jgi:hypothetical protein
MGVVVFGDPNNRFDHIWETAATATAFHHRMIDLCRDDELPGILLEQPNNGLLDFLFSDDVAVADQHFRSLWLADCLSTWLHLSLRLTQSVPKGALEHLPAPPVAPEKCRVTASNRNHVTGL